MKADIDLDENVDLSSGACHAVRPLLRDAGMIDDEGELRASEQPDHTIGVRWINRIGKSYVLESGSGKDFRFAQLRAADADRAVIDLPRRDQRALVGLGMRAQANGVALRRVPHPLNVADGLFAVD